MTPASKLYKVEKPNREERLVLELATALHMRQSKDSVVSVDAQNVAHAFVAKNGYEAGRKLLADLAEAAKRRRRLERLVYMHTHRDYRGKVDGVPSILHLEQGGTVLAPVSSLTDEELLMKLPRAVREAFETEAP